MEQIVADLAWPVVGLIVALVALSLFHAQISALIDRTKKIGKGGIETFENPPAQPTDDRKGIEDFIRGFDSPLLVEAQQLILRDLSDRKIESSGDREKALVRSLASTNIALHFERVHADLYKSQLECLRYLNPRVQGAEVAEIHQFYEHAKTEYPGVYENYSFEQWLGFLCAKYLVREGDSHVSITPTGMEFLQYLLAMRKAGPYHC